MREILIKRIKQSLMEHIGKSCMLAENIADDLIASGVIVPPCKAGQTVYIVDEYSNEFDGIDECKVSQIIDYGSFLAFVFDRDTHGYSESYIGKTIFLTREEAEQALKGGVGE